MKVGILRAELFIPDARSLKAKRQVIRSVKDRLRNTFNCSVAEVDHQDKWQRSTLGIAMAGTDGPYVIGALEELVKFLRREPSLQLTYHEIDTV